MNNRVLATTLIAFIVPSVGSAANPQRVVDQGVVIENVTLISPERPAPLLHADVALRDGRIAEIGTNLVPAPMPKQTLRFATLDGVG